MSDINYLFSAVSGLSGGAAQTGIVPNQQQRGNSSDIPASPSCQPPGAPPPPVPPRHKRERGVERSPSAASGASGATNFGGNRHNTRRNMELTNGNGNPTNSTGMNGGRLLRILLTFLAISGR